MLIKEITLQNFRQFKGKQKLVFATDSNQNVTVIFQRRVIQISC